MFIIKIQNFVYNNDTRSNFNYPESNITISCPLILQHTHPIDEITLASFPLSTLKPESKILFLFSLSLFSLQFSTSFLFLLHHATILIYTKISIAMDLLEGVGESSSPPRSFGGGYSNYDIRTDVYNRLVETGHEQAVSNPEFREQLDSHFNRLPPRFSSSIRSSLFNFIFSLFLLFWIWIVFGFYYLKIWMLFAQFYVFELFS